MLHRIAAVALSLALLASPRAEASSAPPWLTGESRGEDLVITLVTFGPGLELVSWFGHTALAVEDRRLDQGRMYNYGMFSFGDGMLTQFALGRLEFWVGEHSVGGTLRAYAQDGRDVRLQELNLSPARRLVLARALAENALPENRTYLYHHYFDNCATRPRDMLDKALGGQLREATRGPGRMTLRDHTRRFTSVSPPMSLLLDFLMNDEIDRPIQVWDEGFLPSELERQITSLSYRDESGQAVPLVAKASEYFDSPRPDPPEQPPSYGGPLLVVGGLFGAGALALAWKGRGRPGRRILWGLQNAFLGALLGVPSVVLATMWLITEHTVTWRNENLLLASPVLIAALPLGVALAFGSASARRLLRLVWTVAAASALVGLAAKLLPMFDQNNWRLIAFILPIELGLAGAFWLDLAAERATRAAVDPSAAAPEPARKSTSGRVAM